MQFSTVILSTMLASATSVAAFACRTTATRGLARPAFVSSAASTTTRRSFHSSSALQMAKVDKLTNPQENLLDGVDVFIFDSFEKLAVNF